MEASVATARTRFTGCAVILPPARRARTISLRLIMNAASTSNSIPSAMREPTTSGWSGSGVVSSGWRGPKFGSILSVRSVKSNANGRQSIQLMITMAVRPFVVLKYPHKHSLGHQETPFLAQPDKGCLESVSRYGVQRRAKRVPCNDGLDGLCRYLPRGCLPCRRNGRAAPVDSWIRSLVRSRIRLLSCRRRNGGLLIEAEDVASRIAKPGGDLGKICSDGLHDLSAMGDDQIESCSDTVDHNVD